MAKYAFMATGIAPYAAAGCPESGNVPPIVMAVAVTPGTCSAPPNAPGNRERERRYENDPTRNELSHRPPPSLHFDTCLSGASVPPNCAFCQGIGRAARSLLAVSRADLCRERLGLVELAREGVDSARPDPGIGQVEADHVRELLGASTGPQESKYGSTSESPSISYFRNTESANRNP